MPKFFKKEIPSQKIYLPIGAAIAFDSVDDDYGYLRTDDGYIIEELTRAMINGRGGVSEITETEYNDWLKKKQQQPFLRRHERESIGPSIAHRSPSVGAVAAADQMVIRTPEGNQVSDFARPQRSEGLRTDRTFVKPRVGRIGDDHPGG